MGGNAIKISERVPKDRFFKYTKEIIPKVIDAFQTEVHMVSGFHNKQDFGDLDLLVLDIGYENRREIIEKHFNPDEINVNSHVISFNYNELQVDLIFTPIENWESSKIFFNWGDLGNFMGKLINNYGKLRDHGFSMKYGFDGFKCKLLLDGKYKNIYLSKDNRQVFEFLGLDFSQWELGFDEKEDMFDYIIGSKYFDYGSFQWENLNSINKDRNKRRPNYLLFLDYIESHKDSIDWDMGYEFYLNEIKEFFGIDLLKEREIFQKKLDREKENKSKFNGNLIMKMYPNLKGKELGIAINGFQNKFDNFEDYLYNNDSEKIFNDFNEYLS